MTVIAFVRRWIPVPVLLALVVLSALTMLSACAPDREPGDEGADAVGRRDAPGQPVQVQLAVLSSPPHLVTAGQALIEIVQRGGADAAPQLRINGQAAPGPAPQLISEQGAERVYRQLLRDLPEGQSEIQVQIPTTGRGQAQTQTQASLTLVNYPASGPVFSGEPLSPYFCLAELAPTRDGSPRRFAIGNGEYLDGSGADEHCHLPTRIDYVYRSENGDGFLPLPDTDEHPADVARITDRDGNTHPFIVRLETGTLNRAIYQIAMVHDPLTGEPDALMPASPPASAWNQRLVYTYGGGCEAGFFQGTSTGGVLRDWMLAEGYAVASSTLNVNAQGGCNDVLSAETSMMVKSHFISHYGPPVHTIGYGASGGAMQQLHIAGAYPGILDGLLLGMSFSDTTTYFTDSRECVQLRNFINDWADDPARGLTEEVRAAIGGWPDWYLCDQSLGERPDRISPYDCPDVIPEQARYHAVNNPDGVRCSVYDGMRNVFGTAVYADINPERAFGRSPHDNVGVQYGLLALNDGLINTTLFLDINEAFGGWDIDGQRTDDRTVGDSEAIRIAYETGRVTNGSAGLSRVPIIDNRLYLDDEGNFHASIYSFSTRARLERDNGHAGNYVIRRHGRAAGLTAQLDRENLALMDQWLDQLREDRTGAVNADVIAAARPPALQDDCFDTDGNRYVEPADIDADGQCNRLYPAHAGLRLMAGGPLSNDVLRCELKPLDENDYAVTFSDPEWSRLQAIFPDGVCDWNQPGVHQYTNDTWLSFGPSPVNRFQP